MKKHMIIALLVLGLAFAVPAMAGNQNANDNFMSPTQQQNANGNGVNIGGDYNGGTTVEGGVNAYGGDASANNNNMIGNTMFGDTFSPSASATGGDGGDASVYKSGNSTNTIGNSGSVFGDANSFSPSSESNSSIGDITNKNTQTMIGGGNATSVFGDANSGNIQKQGQDQDQDQSQRQSNVNVNGQNQNQNNNQTIAPKQTNKQRTEINQTFKEAENKRSLPTGHGRAYSAKGPDYNSEPNRTGNVQDSADILQVRKTFTLGMLRALEAGEELHVIVKAYQSKREALGYPEKGYKGMPLDATIDILVEVPNMANYRDVAHLTVIGEDDTTTVGSIAAAAVEAMRHGADTLLLTGEGAAKVLEASGWGLMLGGSGTMLISDGGSGAAGAVIAPGIGYSSAKTAYGFCPFVQAFGLVTR